MDNLEIHASLLYKNSRDSVEHPFLLSDNRHYTFYVWRWIFRSHPWNRYLLIPGYMIAFYLTGRTLCKF